MASWTHGENLTVKTRPWLGTNQTPETTRFTGKEMMAEASAERYRTKQQDTPEVAERSAEKWNALSENCWKTSNYKRTLCARDELPRAAWAGGQTGSWLQNQCRDKAHHRRSNPGLELEVVTKKNSRRKTCHLSGETKIWLAPVKENSIGDTSWPMLTSGRAKWKSAA
jgi:hypothetical protein